MIIMSNHQSESTEAQHSAAEAINDANDDIEEALGDVWWRKPAQISAMVSNFSTSYNVVNISIALPILRYLYKGSEEDEAACSSSLLAGMIVGQIIGGALGDSFLGRLGALRLVMSIQIVASLGSAVMLWGEYLYIGLAIWRFILGIGAGAVYPLAATLSAEQAENDHPQQDQELSPDEKVAQVKSVVLTFSMQGVGFLAVSLISVSLLYLMPESSLDAVWRILLGLGSLPGLVLIILQLRMYRRGDSEILPQEESDDMVSNTIMEQRQEPLIAREGEVTAEPNVDEIAELHASHGICTRIRREPNLCQKLVGTACTWFLFDVLFCKCYSRILLASFRSEC
jgi:PHS family inorganic phosphate transporter-like MFS transporter